MPKPVSALYEQGRMRHVGSFPQLQDQMTNFTSDFDREAAGYSPDRLDALVWYTKELLIQPMKGYGIFELYRRQAERRLIFYRLGLSGRSRGGGAIWQDRVSSGQRPG